MKKSFLCVGIVVLSMICLANFSYAGDQGAKEEAVAMVKKLLNILKSMVMKKHLLILLIN